MNESACVRFPKPLDHFPMVLTVAAFISGRPCKNAGLVLIPMIRPLYPVEERRQPLSAVSGPCWISVHAVKAIPTCCAAEKSVRFQICFQHHIETHLIAEQKELGVRRIMRGTDAVDIQLFHQAKILQQFFLCHGIAVCRVRIVMIYALQLDLYAVYRKCVPRIHTILHKADLLADRFLRTRNDQFIEIGLFCIPQNRVVDMKHCCIAKLPVVQTVPGCIQNRDCSRAAERNRDGAIVLRVDVQIRQMSFGA